MSIAVPLYGFGTGGNSLYYSVVCSTTEPAKKEGRIWVKSDVPIMALEWNNVPWSGSIVGTVNIVGYPGGVEPALSNNVLEVFYTKLAGVVNRMKISPAVCKQVQGSTGNWVSVDAYVCHSNTWVQFSASRSTPEFTYTGDYEIVDDSNNTISNFATWTGNWKIRFLTSGTLTFTNLNGWDGKLDVFLVGGGGGGGQGMNSAGAGGGGGYTKTVKAVTVVAGTAYAITIGAGGTVTATTKSNDGGTSSAFGSSSAGGEGGGGIDSSGNVSKGGDGGSGGSGYGSRIAGGTNGGTPDTGSSHGIGQGTTTKEFGETSGTLYSGGGSGGANVNGGTAAAPPADETAGAPGVTPPANRGGGGGGSNHVNINNATAGGSGIVIIRNKR